MDSLDTITLKAFLAALMRLDAPLPEDLQNQLNEIGKVFPSDVSQLHTLAKNYSPLAQEYMDARLALQNDGERFRFAGSESTFLTQASDEKIINIGVEVFKADDSVNLVKKAATESSVLGQILFQLRRQTSFMVKDAQSVTQAEQWLWQDPTVWASLERGLRQAATRRGRYLGDFAQYADLEIDD
ncbi:MAG TPA: hypothetical protein V6D14_00730 [Coleofasciculaceae cyanobacterium]|jgi:hypothetical protein